MRGEAVGELSIAVGPRLGIQGNEKETEMEREQLERGEISLKKVVSGKPREEWRGEWSTVPDGAERSDKRRR